MTPRKIHKTIGLILLLPFISWSLTAAFFLLRPRYEQAYETLAVRQYPLPLGVMVPALPQWQEVRYFHSILGPHLLVKQSGGWQHLDPATLHALPPPDNTQLTLLLEDAFSANPARYGDIASIEGNHITTSTGVDIRLDWDTLAFTQQGRDTRWINKVYEIHYLEWTGIGLIDKILGLSGLALLFYMTWSGGRLALGRPQPRPAPPAGS